MTTFQPKPLPQQHYIKNFLLHYKKLVDTNLLRNDHNAFNTILDSTRAEVLKIPSVQMNTLFFSTRNIGKMVFLTALSRFPKLVSYRVLTVLDLVDIWWRNNTHDNLRKNDDEVFNTEQDIRDDVLCVLYDPSMFITTHNSPIISSVVSSRACRVNSKGIPLITWIFYGGTQDDFKKAVPNQHLFALFNSDPTLYQMTTIQLTTSARKISSQQPKRPTSIDDFY